MVRPSPFDDSDFELDAIPVRPPAPRQLAPAGHELDRLAWTVLVALIFCPLLGFALAGRF